MIGVIIFELAIVLYAILLWWYMSKKGYKNIPRKMLILFIGVLLFELMSEPMWENIGFGAWAYIYRDITWVITLGWVCVFMTAILVVDYGCRNMLEKKKFWLYLLFVEVVVVPIESGMLMSGVRQYAPVLTSTMSGLRIPFTPVPLEAIFAVPLFAALILAFYKYINHLFESRA